MFVLGSDYDDRLDCGILGGGQSRGCRDWHVAHFNLVGKTYTERRVKI